VQVPPLVDVAPGQRAACRILGADVPPAFGLAAA
jgi:hypothetical protein